MRMTVFGVVARTRFAQMTNGYQPKPDTQPLETQMQTSANIHSTSS